jgi:hypothetical protein
MESSEAIGNADVQKILKRFHCVKIDATKATTIPKNWPKDIIKLGTKNKACLVLLSPDQSKQFVIKKGANDGVAIEANPKNIIAAAETLVKYQDGIVAAKQEKAKKEEPPEKKVEEPKKQVVPGLKDPDAVNDKKDEKKAPPAKKVEGPADE